MSNRVLRSGWVLATLLVLTPVARAQVVQITPSADNTLFEPDDLGDRSSAVGPQVFAGRVGGVGGTVGRRRGVLVFDVAGSVPAGSTILEATLTLQCSHAPVFDQSNTRTQRLRRATADWGEGTSDGGINNGTGAAPTTGDATWSHTFYPGSFWTSAGGDFVGTVSSSVGVTGTGTYTFPSTAQLVTDVQSMLDNPLGNFGWVLSGEEVISGTARAFDSREAPTYPLFNGTAPVLEVTYAASVPSLPGASLALLVVLAVGGGALLIARRG
jgi:hypothetical protein